MKTPFKIHSPVNGTVTQDFYTSTINPKTKKSYIKGRTKHEAIDIVTTGPKPIHAPYSGTIIKSFDGYGEEVKSGFGNRIYLRSDDGNVVDSFAHLHEWSALSSGEHVEQGDYLGETGRTGYRKPLSTWHTHHEREVNGKRVDPLDDSTLPDNYLSNEDMERLDKLEALNKEQEKAHTALFKRLDKIDKRLDKIEKALKKVKAKKKGKKGIIKVIKQRKKK